MTATEASEVATYTRLARWLIATPHGRDGKATVAVTELVAVSRTVTADSAVVTYTRPVRWLRAMPHGRDGSVTVATTSRVVPSRTVTLSEPELAT